MQHFSPEGQQNVWPVPTAPHPIRPFGQQMAKFLMPSSLLFVAHHSSGPQHFTGSSPYFPPQRLIVGHFGTHGLVAVPQSLSFEQHAFSHTLEPPVAPGVGGNRQHFSVAGSQQSL